jgi:hypothetical protein
MVNFMTINTTMFTFSVLEDVGLDVDALPLFGHSFFM